MLAEAPGIQTLAEHMATRRWVDMRVATIGRVDRVRIFGIDIRLDRDDVHVRQKFIDEGEERVVSRDHKFDCEDIRWCKPTRLMLDQVKPLKAPRPQRTAEGQILGADAQGVILAVIQATEFITRTSRVEIVQGGNYAQRVGLHARRIAMWVAFELTDLPPKDICKQFGYASAQPLVTVHQTIDRWKRSPVPPADTGQFVEYVRKVAAATDARLRIRLRRTVDTSWPRVAL